MERIYSFFIGLIVFSFLFNVTSSQAQDTTRPVLIIKVSSDTQIGSFDVEFDFGEPVTGFTRDDIRVFVKLGPMTATFSTLRSGDNGAKYIVRIYPQMNGADRGTLFIEVAEGAAQDLGNNDNYGDRRHVFVFSATPQDNTRPLPTIKAPMSEQTGLFDVEIEFNEPVTGFRQSDVDLSWSLIGSYDPNNPPRSTLTILNWTAHRGGERYTFTVRSSSTLQGNVSINVPENVAVDGAGNGNYAGIGGGNGGRNPPVTVTPPATSDTTRPTVTISTPSSIQTGSFDVTITFSEVVVGFTQNELRVSGAGASITVWNPDSNRRVYIATIKPTGDGIVRFNVSAFVAQDQAGNRNVAASQQTVTVDLPDPPAITASISAPSGVQRGPFDVTVIFSQTVEGFVQEGLNVSGTNGVSASAAGASITAWTESDGRRYTATITPTMGGEVILTVAANVADEMNRAATPVTVVFWSEDVDRDGYIGNDDLFAVASNFGRSLNDILAEINRILNPRTGTTSATFDGLFYNPDVDRDGDIDTTDFRRVLNYLGRSISGAAPTASATPHAWLQRIKALNIEDPEFQELLQSLEQQLPAPAPKATVLLANYPNPFNPETWIPYQLAKPADVTVTIYAANGEVVWNLQLGHQPAGNYLTRARAAYWDGKNALGESVASGIYFYTLITGDFSATRKMLIAK